MNNIIHLSLVLLGIAFLLMFVVWIVKEVYEILRLVWIMWLNVLQSPTARWEMQSGRKEELRERFVPVLRSIERDAVYSTLDFLSKPLSLAFNWIREDGVFYWCHRKGIVRLWRKRHFHRKNTILKTHRKKA